MSPTLRRAAAASPVHYERRRPEETTLYRLVQEHLETFLVQAIKVRRSEAIRAEVGLK